jgi:tRNA (cytidine/uridine-2'-O-)-methyltransferase
MNELNVVLFQPEIPHNTGNVVRTCAALGAKLHLILPLGFSMDDRYLKRAGLDYWHMVEIVYYDNVEDFLAANAEANHIFITKKASKSYDQADFSGSVFLIFGRETTGLPDSLLKQNRESCYRIPMQAEARSLNLSNAVAVVAYEACRRSGFKKLKLDGSAEFS